MDWMQKLPEIQKKKSLDQIVMPGSHDSGAYSLNVDGLLAPGQPGLFKISKCIVYNWSRTQNLDFRQQLELGVRYFDLRVAPNPTNDEICFVHGLYGKPVKEELRIINEFLHVHPSEVIILDFNHFLGFKDDHHEILATNIQSCFTSKLERKQENLWKVTLQEMLAANHQVVVFYNHQIEKDYLWESKFILSPWPRVQNKVKLIEFLGNNISNRPGMKCYVSQGVLTPTTSSVVTGFCSSLEQWSATAREAVTRWVEDTAPRSKLNIVITDFVDKMFVEAVINCNVRGADAPMELR